MAQRRDLGFLIGIARQLRIALDEGETIAYELAELWDELALLIDGVDEGEMGESDYGPGQVAGDGGGRTPDGSVQDDQPALAGLAPDVPRGTGTLRDHPGGDGDPGPILNTVRRK